MILHIQFSCDHPACDATIDVFHVTSSASALSALRDLGWSAPANGTGNLRYFCPEHSQEPDHA